jgi:hypothetical protein
MKRDEDLFSKLGALIPGYAGYANRDNRRKSDKLIRDKISALLTSIERTLQSKLTSTISSGETESAVKLEQVRKRINTLSSRVQFLPYGESSFFNDKQIKEEELAKLQQMDLFLLNQVESLSQLVQNASQEEIDKAMALINSTLHERSQYLKEYK